MMKEKGILVMLCVVLTSLSINAQRVDYSVVYVPEESGMNFTRITNDNDYVCMPLVKRTQNRVNWLTNRIIDVSADGKQIAYMSARNNTTNIFIKDVDKQGSSIQRTNRNAVLDFSYSPDGKYIVFSEKMGKMNQIFQTDAKSGFVCRQITSANQDYTPIYNTDMNQIFFARQEQKGLSIWSYNIKNNFLSSYTTGFNPFPIPNTSSVLCTRFNANGMNEVWRINYETGVEECIVADAQRSFASPSLSPDGQWILLVGTSSIPAGGGVYNNTDIFVCKNDGTQLLQLTYHAADDVSPTWSKDGRYIYFISQRGSTTGTANIWKMEFIH